MSLHNEIVKEIYSELKKFKKKNKLNIKNKGGIATDAKRLAFLVVWCYVSAKSIVFKRNGRNMVVNDSNIGALEPQVFTVASELKIKCSNLLCEIPVKSHAPKIQVTPWTENGFRKVEVSSEMREFILSLLNVVVKLEK